MAKIEKDQFEEFLEQNSPDEEPSEAVFQRLQREAAWNQPPAASLRPIFLAFLAVITAGIILLVIGYMQTSSISDARKPLKKEVPVIEEPEITTINVIASNDIPSDLGFSRLMKNRSDDFYLSFKDDLHLQKTWSQDFDSI